MSDQFEALTDKHIEFINKQKMYFVSTAGAQGRVNLSPKGLDSLRVINNKSVIWLNLTGSGNETAAHVLENQRMTIMFCSFDKQPIILRLYGLASMIKPEDDRWAELIALFPEHLGARQIFDLSIDLVQRSCGYAVPYYDFVEERPTLLDWSNKKTDDEMEAYWSEVNALSLDGKETGS